MSRYPPNPHKDEILRLRREGMWPTEIAKHLGITRNAVIGMCHRAGLQDPNVDRSALNALFGPKGEAAGGAKLTEAQVRAARAAYVRGSRANSAAALAKRCGVSRVAMRAAIMGLTWAHVA